MPPRLHNEEADSYRRRKTKMQSLVWDRVLDIAAAFWVYFVNMIGFETVLILLNAGLATAFFLFNDHYLKYSVKLDFSFLAFSVVFPLTFLVQSTFSRRDQALSKLADFKATMLSTALFTLTVDWAAPNGDPIGGRMALPSDFNRNVVRDFQDVIQLVYEYLSMTPVMHARNIVFPCKQGSVVRVHGKQNDLVKRLNESMFDMAMHTEELRKYNFPRYATTGFLTSSLRFGLFRPPVVVRTLSQRLSAR